MRRGHAGWLGRGQLSLGRGQLGQGRGQLSLGRGQLGLGRGQLSLGMPCAKWVSLHDLEFSSAMWL